MTRMPAPDSTRRFSSRIENYIKYRPSYPAGVLDLLAAQCGLSPTSVVADIGAGTGILTGLLLERGCTVFAVEPNDDMRRAAERLLAGSAKLHSVAGTAEATTLPDHGIDIAVAAQAFHWFDVPRTRIEWRRILKPGGFAVLVWNTRRPDSTPFLRDYENLLLTYGTDYAAVGHREVDPNAMDSFFGAGHWRRAAFDNVQFFDYAGLEGRLLSSSYTPQPGDARYEPMLAGLRAIFDAYAVNGQVAFEYDAEVYWGPLRP